MECLASRADRASSVELAEPKVSVVVPVYNTAPYLRQCLDSIANQTLREIEIICVDDGSTDGSLEILREYEGRDDRFVVLRQQNKFAGVARNRGMEQARSDFLVFWDSDDFFEPQALEVMYKQIVRHEADICVCGANQYFQATGELKPSSRYLAEGRLPRDAVFNRHTHNDCILSFATVMPWNKMFRRTFVRENHLKFQSRRNSNDTYFCACALLLADRIVTVPDRMITYRVGRAGSLVGGLARDPLANVAAWADVRRDMSGLSDFPENDYFFKVLSVLLQTRRQLKGKNGSHVLRMARRGGVLRDVGLTGRSIGFYLHWIRWLFDRCKKNAI